MDIQELYAVYQLHPRITTDSRDCPADSIFFALRGTTFDGNQYAASALEKGCAAAVIDEAQYAEDDRFILVPDVLETLQELAAYHRQQWGGTVLQITGTNGKTTTKELIAAVLSKGQKVLFTEGNLNNHIGVPRTLLRITSEHDIAVIETGANHLGEIESLCKIVKADCGLITNVGRAHLEGFGSFDGVKKAKGELYDDLSARNAYIFINGMDDDLREMATERGFLMEETAVPYVEGRVVECNPMVCVQWREDDWKPWHTIQTRLVGAYNVTNIRAAITVGLKFGISPEQIDEAIANYEPTNSRSEYRDTGKNHLIVDAYNANPTSMVAALDNFSMIEAPHKMVILGDMRELGEESLAEHRKIVERLINSGIETIWLVGQDFKEVTEASGHSSQMSVFEDVDVVKAALQETPIEGRTILVKGSNGTRLYQLPDLL